MDPSILYWNFVIAEWVVHLVRLGNAGSDRRASLRDEDDWHEHSDGRNIPERSQNQPGDRPIRANRICFQRGMSEAAKEGASAQPGLAYFWPLKLFPHAGTA